MTTHDFINDTIALDKAIEALERWLQSQDMTPRDSGVLLNAALAKWLVCKTRDIRELQEAIKIHSLGLSVEVIRFWKEYK